MLKALQPIAVRVNELESVYAAMSDGELKSQTGKLKERLERGESLDTIEPDAYAVVREASKRVLRMRHFDVQILGGATLHRGRIAEMRTGEGKTLVATLPSYLNALSGKGVHIVTVNDYLARRDAEWMGQIHRFLGLTVGVVLPGQTEETKRSEYLCDITYGQNNEFGFDYLRDNMKFNLSDLVQRGHNFAVVDEVDSILIDEARTPLIISGPSADSTELYVTVNAIIPRLVREEDFEVDLKSKQPSLKEEGIAKCEKLLGVTNLYDPQHLDLVHHINQGLRAHVTMQRDVDYVVKDGQVIIVDEFTGRLMPGRAWSNGLHQAVEAKEGLKVKRENQTLASITFQNYFRLYAKLSGMTGTADTEAAEFKKIYNLEVSIMPTNRPMVRDDESDRVFRTRKEKFTAVIEDIEEVHKTGQPILVGTISIEQSEFLSRMLQQKGIEHNVLNAKHHEREADIVAQAGRFAGVTIATNMAGRGTDILLGGNPEFLAVEETGIRDRANQEFRTALDRLKLTCDEEKKRVVDAGGLFVMGTERHEARRIDNQLRGRAGRQGDPGRSRFYVSLEDDLMMRFGGEKMQQIMQRLGWEEGMALDGSMVTRAILRAQQRVEALHFDMRKNLLDFDDVMNKQRMVVYNLRSRLLHNQGVRDEVLLMIDDLLEEVVLAVCDEKKRPVEWNIKQIEERFSFLFNSPFAFSGDVLLDQQNLFDIARDEGRKRYLARVETLSARLAELGDVVSRDYGSLEVQIAGFERKPFDMNTVEQEVMLETLDHLWLLHLQDMDHLREGIDLRGYGQKNPLHEYQREGFITFQTMIANFKEASIRKLFFYEVPDPKALLQHLQEEQRRREEMELRMQTQHQSVLADAGTEQEAEGRNADEARAKIAAQRKERRKLGKK